MTGKGIVLFSILLLASDVASDLVNPLPQNKAVVNGATRVAFSCTSSPNGWGAIGWNVMRVGEPAAKNIANGGSVFPGYADAYELSQTGSLTSTLIIKTVNESLAGTYTCNEGTVAAASAQLIVYNADPVCTPNLTGQVLTQGQSVQLSCSFSYTANNSSVDVNMAWSKGSPSSPVQSPSPDKTTAGTLTTAVSTINQTVGYSSPFPVYRCQTSFKVTGTTATNVATNDPGYTNTAQPYNSPINVTYFNPNCSITGANSGDTVYSGATITCEVDANPRPNFIWSNGTKATLSSAPSLAITNDGEYTCTVSNSVGSCTKSINLTTRTTTAAPTTTITTTITPPFTSSQTDIPSLGQSKTGELSETNKIIIGVVVGVGGFLLILAIIIIICCCKKKNKSGAKYENGNQDITQMTSGAYKKMGTEGNLHQKQASTNVSSAPQSNNSAPKKVDDFSAVDESKVANAKANEDVLIYADLARETHPSLQSEQSDKNPEQSDKKPDQLDKKPDQKITDNGTYADIREA